jgi:hypothetical protein
VFITTANNWELLCKVDLSSNTQNKQTTRQPLIAPEGSIAHELTEQYANIHVRLFESQEMAQS